MHSLQNAIDHVTDMMQQGKMTADQANVRVVQMTGFRVVTKLQSQVRKVLNAAVKSGELGHLKKDGLKPEIYFHKNGRANAIEERNRIERNAKDALKAIFGANR